MSLNTQSLQPIINFLWTVADDVLVNTYQKGKYKDVILSMEVIRRIDLLLDPTKEQVLKTFNDILLKDDIQELFEREVLPFAIGNWWDKKETKIGYEINFAKYFSKHQPPRALVDIATDIFAIEQQTKGLLKKIIE